MSLSSTVMVEKSELQALVSRSRLRRLVNFSALQVLVQLVGFAAGIVLVRHMPQQEYGWFTTLLTLVGLGSVLMDLGLSSAVLAQGGVHHADPPKLADLLADAFGIQWRLVALVLLPLMAYAAFLLVGQAVPAIAVAGLVAGLAMMTWLQARNAIWLSVVRLRGDIRLQQCLDFGCHAGRLVLVLALAQVLTSFGVLAAGLTVLLPAAAAAVVLRRHTRQVLGPASSGAQHGFTQGLRSFVVRQAPNSIYYCIAGQVPVWVVGWFGHAERVAEVGALGRLAMIFTVIGSVLTALVQPYFARPRRPRELLQTLVLLNGLFAGFSGCLVLCAWLLPGPMLWVLGPHYSGLHTELIWMVLAASLASWSGAVYGLGAARGWMVPTPWVVSLGITTVLAACWFLDLSSVTGALQMQTAMAAVTAVLVLSHVATRMLRHLREEQGS